MVVAVVAFVLLLLLLLLLLITGVRFFKVEASGPEGRLQSVSRGTAQHQKGGRHGLTFPDKQRMQTQRHVSTPSPFPLSLNHKTLNPEP